MAAAHYQWVVHTPAAALSALALLSAGLLGVFTQLSSLRIRLTDRPDEEWLDVERDGIDEAVAHVLTAFTLCIVACVLLVIGMNSVTDPQATSISTFWSVPVFAVGSYIVALFAVLVPKLYSAYVEMNAVRSKLNGFHKSR